MVSVECIMIKINIFLIIGGIIGAIMNSFCIGLAFYANESMKGGEAIGLTILNFLIAVALLIIYCCARPKKGEPQAPYIGILTTFGVAVM